MKEGLLIAVFNRGTAGMKGGGAVVQGLLCFFFFFHAILIPLLVLSIALI